MIERASVSSSISPFFFAARFAFIAANFAALSAFRFSANPAKSRSFLISAFDFFDSGSGSGLGAGSGSGSGSAFINDDVDTSLPNPKVSSPSEAAADTADDLKSGFDDTLWPNGSSPPTDSGRG